MKNISRIERLAKREEKAIVKRIFLLTAISIVLIIGTFTVGIPVLGKFADVLESVFKSPSAEEVEAGAPPIPTLDTLPPATNQESLTVSGFSTDSEKVEVFTDLQKVGEALVENGKFKYENFTLVKGENRISVKALNSSGKSSDFSQTAIVIFDNDEPTLEVTKPKDGEEFKGDNRIKVEGKVEKNAQVFANGFLGNVDGDGNFDVTVPILEGENNLEVKAIDDAQNTREIKLKVIFRK